ncbi:MAG: double-strand break repair protein AddB [Rhodospirillales bacterium]
MTSPSLSSIPFGVPFLDALASWWLSRAAGDPLRIADGIVLLPTRRAARGLTEAFLRQTDGKPVLLPRIVALGGLDEAKLALEGALDVPPSVPPTRRLAVLARLILAMGGRHGAPTASDQAWMLAEELAVLLDEAARAEVDLRAALPNAVGREFAEHWNVTLQFLGIVTEAWPAWLAEAGFFDVAARQIALLEAQTAAWQAAPPGMPVVAAGMTGAIPAVARLLRVVAHMPEGQVVLPGLDTELDDASWEQLDETHPQAGLRALLASLGAVRGDVAVWDAFPAVAPAARVATLRLALLPAATLDRWRASAPPETAGLLRLAPSDQQEEAVAIALALREALEQPGARAALVTQDRQLAQRVTAELLRFGVVADDSAGEKLAETPPALFLRLLAEAAAENLRPVKLLALLKHPLAAAGLAAAACRSEARALELSSLRGPAPEAGMVGLRRAAADPEFCDRLAACLAALPAPGVAVACDALLRALLQAAEALATTDAEPGATRLWSGEEGEALAEHLTALLGAFADLPPDDVAALPGLLEAALAGVAVRSRRALRGRDGGEHPRVFIWGLLEARLQSAEFVVLGGLSEGVWPPQSDPGPWMNRAMRALVGLESPEAAIGQAAHDFCAAACAGRVAVLSAPRRRDGAPAVAARWLTRLDALLAGHDRALPGHGGADWAGLLDRPAGAAVPAAAPAPSPPVALRPRRLRVTEIELLIRDPYAIYARHVLGLEKLKPLEESADAADYGNVVHVGLHKFYQLFGTAWPADAAAQLTGCMDEALEAAKMRPALAAWWRPRLRRIAVWVAEAEVQRRSRHGRLELIRSEQKGVWTFAAPAGPFTLHGRADRIERMFDGGIAILDYKTGALPAQKDVQEGRAPQLPLEAAMASEGAFGADLKGRAFDLTYWHISGGHQPGEARQLFKGDPEKVAAEAAWAAEKLLALVADFDRPQRAYLSQPYPDAAPRFSDYAHLARVAEWASVEE